MQESGEREVRGEREEGRGEKEEMRRGKKDEDGKRMKMEKGREEEEGREGRSNMIVKLHVQSVLACIEWGPQDLR